MRPGRSATSPPIAGGRSACGYAARLGPGFRRDDEYKRTVIPAAAETLRLREREAVAKEVVGRMHFHTLHRLVVEGEDVAEDRLRDRTVLVHDLLKLADHRLSLRHF